MFLRQTSMQLLGKIIFRPIFGLHIRCHRDKPQLYIPLKWAGFRTGISTNKRTSDHTLDPSITSVTVSCIIDKIPLSHCRTV